MKSPNTKLLFALFAVFYSLASNANSTAKNLTLIEQKIAQTIDSTKQNYLTVLKQTVNINSGTMNFDGVKETGKVMQKEFDKLGFETRWIDGKAFNRAGHLYASFGVDSRSNNKKVLLIGHLDTVFASNSPFQSYQELGDDKVAGPGITDMKGGNVIILSILDALKKNGALEKLQVKIMLMGDEEKRGAPYQVATKELVGAGKWADIAMGFEDGDGDPKTAVISRRGATGWKLTVKGRPAHSSQIFREGYGYGAIFETARILNAFREELSKEPNLTFNPGIIVGGTDVEFDKAAARGTAFGKSNVISETTIVHGDIRALSPEQLEFAHKTMKNVVKDNLADTSAELEFYDGYPPMAPSDGNRKLLAMYDQASQDLGFGKVLPVDPRKAGAADVSFVANHVEMALDGLGLMGTGGHTVKEVADIATFTSQAKRAAILLHRFANQ